MKILSFACLQLLTLVFIESSALQCYKCNQATHATYCNVSITCQTSETCYTNAYHDSVGVKFTMGCIDHNMCSQLSASSSLVGKRQLECHQCCGVDYCNIDLCGNLESGKCEDDEQEDCTKWDSLIQICQDIPHARLVCPRYCNLCNITDGGWSLWSSWSTCSVTCDSGHRTRNRQCNNPTPSRLGDNCKGLSNERSNCSFKACPVHGGWTKWSSWGACSVSCDIGIQRRDRACANPYPSSDGDFCYGESRDDRICSVQACADGGWSDWGTWSACSLTCGGGIHSRSRTCSNPVPSVRGQYCNGDPIEVKTCNGDICPETLVTQNIIFQARTLKDSTLDTNQILIFTNVIQNAGNGYNSQTGKFTAPVGGAYLFTFQYCVYYQKHFFYAIVVDNVIHTAGHGYDQNHDPCSTADALMTLNAGQSVWIKATSTSQLYESSSSTVNYWNIFSGLLVHK